MARTAAQIQTVLDAFYAAQLALATHQSYSLDTGQGRQTVTRANLTEINRTIQALETELSEIVDGANPGIEFERYGA